jgi:hypothetical protein
LRKSSVDERDASLPLRFVLFHLALAGLGDGIKLGSATAQLLDASCDTVAVKRSHRVESLQDHQVQRALHEIEL